MKPWKGGGVEKWLFEAFTGSVSVVVVLILSKGAVYAG
jgi:hypothetical protein